MSSFSAALSAMRAATEAVDAVGHNLANLNTTGFKRTELSFEELMYGYGTNQVGGGVGRVYTNRVTTQGPVSTTNNPLDVAIQGNGYLLAKTPSSSTMMYTRDGRLRLDSDGYLTTFDGARLQGWSGKVPTPPATSGAPGDIQVSLGSTLAATPTSSISFSGNLDATSATGSAVSMPVEVYDNRGNSHVVSLTFTKGDGNSWNLTMNSSDPAIQSLGTPNPASITFDGGKLAEGTPATIGLGPIAYTPESGLTGSSAISWSLKNATSGSSLLTQYAQPSTFSSVTQDGSAAASLSDVKIADGGRIMATYSNGKQYEVARLAMALVQSPDALTPVGDNFFIAGLDAGAQDPAQAGQGGLGKLLGQSIEGSNVDLADQFTELITYQRGYQASSRVITTVDELIQESISLKR